jgi:Ca-activated chloride channel family protein
MIIFSERLWLLLLIPLLGILFFYRFFKGKAALQALGGLWREQSLLQVHRIKMLIVVVSYLFLFTMLILAISGLSWGEESSEISSSGSDLVILLDISWSMLVEDAEGSRLDMARRMLSTVVDNLDETRIGFVALKGDGIKMLPLTFDRFSVLRLISEISPQLVTIPGTNIEKGLVTSYESFIRSENKRKHILLLSDGESLTGRPLGLRLPDVQIHTILIGREGPIPMADGSVLLDSSGTEIISRANPRLLAELSERSGGLYIDSNDDAANRKLFGLIQAIGGGERTEFSNRIINRYQLLSFLAFIALSIIVITRSIRWREF